MRPAGSGRWRVGEEREDGGATEEERGGEEEEVGEGKVLDKSWAWDCDKGRGEERRVVVWGRDEVVRVGEREGIEVEGRMVGERDGVCDADHPAEDGGCIHDARGGV